MIPDISTLWVVFFLLLCTVLLNTLIFKPILKVIEQRTAAVRGARELAESAATKAAAAAAEYTSHDDCRARGRLRGHRRDAPCRAREARCSSCPTRNRQSNATRRPPPQRWRRNRRRHAPRSIAKHLSWPTTLSRAFSAARPEVCGTVDGEPCADTPHRPLVNLCTAARPRCRRRARGRAADRGTPCRSPPPADTRGRAHEVEPDGPCSGRSSTSPSCAACSTTS